MSELLLSRMAPDGTISAKAQDNIFLLSGKVILVHFRMKILGRVVKLIYESKNGKLAK